MRLQSPREHETSADAGREREREFAPDPGAAGRGWLAVVVAVLVASGTGGTGCLPDKPEQDPAPVVELVEEPDPEPEVLGTDPVEEPEFVPGPEAEQLTVNKEAEVAILCYHDFTEGVSKNDMVINIGEFRGQMEALAAAEIPVIGMDEFLAWRRGESEIPDPSVLITIDDGWDSVYELAYPVLKEHGFPFTLFLYAQYVSGGGRSLGVDEIAEMVEGGGATVGCHSFTHPHPARVREAAGAGGDQYDAFLLREMEAARMFLEENLGLPISTYAYPGGVYTDRMVELNEARLGYEAMFTIDPQKARWDAEVAKVGRYVVLGRDDANFRLATTFSGISGSVLDRAAGVPVGLGELAPEVSPADGATVSERRPVIAATFPDGAEIEPGSIEMRVVGFGLVPATYDEETKTISWSPRAKLRDAEVEVGVSFVPAGAGERRTVYWKFGLELSGAYLGVTAPPPAAGEAKPEPAVPAEGTP